MKKSLFLSLKSFFTEPRWEKVRGVFWFCLITTIIHITWRFWANTFNFYPVQDLIKRAEGFLVYNLIKVLTFIINDLLNINISISGRSIITANRIQLIMNDSASGLKQMIQFGLLMLIFPGPWKHKAWFIPLGFIILHLTNVFRIICLVVIAIHWPQQIHYAHDNWLRILYYIVIFGLWLVWVERVTVLKEKK